MDSVTIKEADKTNEIEEFESVEQTTVIEEQLAPGLTVESLLQGAEEVESTIDSVYLSRQSVNHSASIIAELEAETTKESKTDQDGPLVNGAAYIVADDEQPSCSTEETAPDAISSVLDSSAIPDDLQYYADLRSRNKHFFILSEAGKPIYSRYGNEEDNASLSCVIQALVSFVETNDESHDYLEYVTTDNCRLCFLHRSHLILISLSKGSRCSSYRLKQQLNLIYHLILSLLTRTRLIRIFSEQKNYDLRRLLTNTDKMFENLIHSSETDFACMMSAVKCLNMPSSTRDVLNQTLASSIGKPSNLVFAIILVNDQLVAMSRMKKYTLHPLDLGLLISLVSTNTSSYENAELWLPFCLPRLDDSAFLYAHISRITEQCDACMILLTIDKSAFFSLSRIKSSFVEKLLKTKTLQPFIEACNAKRNVKLSEMMINDLWHFLYKNRSSSQIICPDYEVPYKDAESQKRLWRTYFNLHTFMHSSCDNGGIMKIYFMNGDKENLLAWITGNFELYAVFSPLVAKSVAIGNVERLMRWLKKEEDHLFILNPVLL